jgi:nucleotide-binding universal stress UspA family protein
MKNNSVLCPVDFSEPSALALRMAGRLAVILHSELDVLHAQRWELPPYFTVAQTRTLQAQIRKSERAARKYFEDFVKQNLSEEIQRRYHLVEDDPVAAILRSSRELGADLIVMGTHGRTGWSRVRLGSVMEGVLRQAGVPVVAIGPEVKKSVPQAGIREILCPVSFDDLSRATVKLAAFLAGKAGSRLTVLHVVEPDSTTGESRKGAEKRLCDWVAEEANGQCSTREVVHLGEPVEAIVGEARRSRSDLLVIGARPRSSLGTFLFGTTTEVLIRSAPCPVLVVPAPGAGTERTSI